MKFIELPDRLTSESSSCSKEFPRTKVMTFPSTEVHGRWTSLIVSYKVKNEGYKPQNRQKLSIQE